MTQPPIVATLDSEDLRHHRVGEVFEKISMTKTYSNEKITFYDASYIVASKITEATLVTEDKELREKAGKHVNTATYTQFKQKVKP